MVNNFMKIMKMLESINTAAAFAEAGEWDTALDLMKADENKKKIIVAYDGEPAERRVMQAVIPVAARLQCELLFACIQGRAKAEKCGRNFHESSNRSFKQIFSEEVERLSIPIAKMKARQIVVFKSFFEAVNEICTETREVKFVILRCDECNPARLHIDVPHFYLENV